MKWRAFGRMPQWVRLSEWLGVRVLLLNKWSKSVLNKMVRPPAAEKLIDNETIRYCGPGPYDGVMCI